MICIFDGRAGGPVAGDIQKLVGASVGPCDASPEVLHQKEGRTVITRDGSGLELRRVTTPEPSYIVSSLGFDVADLPDGLEFGNGVTVNRSVTLKDGRVRLISYCCLPDTVAVLTDAQKKVLRDAFALEIQV